MSRFCNARIATSMARKPDVSSLEIVKLGPPKRNCRAIRLAVMLASPPIVLFAVNAGPVASRSDFTHAAKSSSVRFSPSRSAHARAFADTDQRSM